MNLIDYYNLKFGVYPTDTWHIDYNRKCAFKIYSDFDSIDPYDQSLIVQHPKEQFLTINNFSDEDSVEFYNTKIIDDPYGGQAVVLELNDRIVSILIDQSGSMTWNDSRNFRYDIVSDIVTRLDATYPGNIYYNLSSFGGAPIYINMDAFGSGGGTGGGTGGSSGSSSFAGVRVLRKSGSFSLSPLDGDIVKEGFFKSVADIDLVEGTEYYYSVYTYNSSYVFGKPSQIKITPRDNIIPKGVSLFSQTALVGSGVLRDSNSESIWHIDEGIGDHLYNFADRDFILNISNCIWNDKIKSIPSGIASIRFNGQTSYASSINATDKLSLDSAGVKTIMFWIRPVAIGPSGNMIVSRQSASGINYILYINSSGGVSVSFDGVDTVSSVGAVIDISYWSHIAVTIGPSSSPNNISFYINGVFAGEQTLPSWRNDSDMIFDIGYNRTSILSIDHFYGEIAEVSIHKDIKDISYIQRYSRERNSSENLYNAESAADGSITNLSDNGDRLSLLSFIVTDLADYSRVKILRKSFSSPVNFDDGDEVFYGEVGPGEYIVEDIFEGMIGSVYYYRIFTQNSIGNYCYNDNADVREYLIPKIPDSVFEDIDSVNPPLSTIENAVVINGDKQVYLHWSLPNDSRIAGVRIYSSTASYPSISDIKTESTSSGNLIFEGDLLATEYTHRDILNNQNYYYTIAYFNRYGQNSNAVNLLGYPQGGLVANNIPIKPVSNLNAELISSTSIKLTWETGGSLKNSDNNYFDQVVSLSASINSDSGYNLGYNIDVEMRETCQLQYLTDAQPDVFKRVFKQKSQEPSSLYLFNVQKTTQSDMSGTIMMVPTYSLLNNVEKAAFSIYLYAKIPNPANPNVNLFEYRSDPIEVIFINPISLRLDNRDKKYVTKECPGSESAAVNEVVGDMIGRTIKIDGVPVRTPQQFVVRAFFNYKNGGFDTSSIKPQVVIFDISQHIDFCDEEFSYNEIDVSTLKESKDVKLVSQDIELLFNEIEDENGVVGKEYYFDLILTTPDSPKNIFIYVGINYGGFSIIKRMLVNYENSLKINLQGRAPLSNGIDVAEQTATVTLGSDEFAINVPDGTLVRWELSADYVDENTVGRPFYSTESVGNISELYLNSISGYAFSTTVGGLAGNVFFGPAKNVQSRMGTDPNTPTLVVGETYTLKASVNYLGLSASATTKLTLAPTNIVYVGKRFLMSFPQFKSSFYADGIDYAKLTIDANPHASSSGFAACYLNCMTERNLPAITLPLGTIISIDIGKDYEIIWGNGVVENIDEYSGRKYLTLSEDSHLDVGAANIVIFSDENPVYFRLNKSIPKPEPKSNSPSLSDFTSLLTLCECISSESIRNLETGAKYEAIVSGDTIITVNGVDTYVSGGGGASNGIPPTILCPVEPLSVKFVGVGSTQGFSQGIITDGLTVNDLYFEVSFSGGAVPNGTPLYINILSLGDGISSSNITSSSNIIYTNLSVMGSVSTERSYAKLSLNPINKDTDLNEAIIARCTYDKVGSAAREEGVCLNIVKTIDSEEDGDDDNTVESISKEAWAYNTVSSEWIKLSDMDIGRVYSNSHFYDGYIYVFGGICGSGLLNRMDRYDITNNRWDTLDRSPIGLFGSCSVLIGDNIYIFGGISLTDGGWTVSNKSFMYSIVSDDWAVVEDMPLKVAFAGCVYGESSNGKVYILSGARSVVSSTLDIGTYNDCILVYDISSDSWEVHAVDELFLDVYERLFPLCILKSNEIIVCGGASLKSDSISKDIIYNTDSYKINIPDLGINFADNYFNNIPSPRYKASITSIGNDYYIFGGSNKKSQYLKTFERLDTSLSEFTINELSAEHSGSSVGIAAGTIAGSNVFNYHYGGVPHIFFIGGNSSGRDPGFLKINTTPSDLSLKLNGKEGLDIRVEMLDENGDPPSRDILIFVRGFLKFKNSFKESDLEDTSDTDLLDSDQLQIDAAKNINEMLLIYPVVFESNNVTVTGGTGTISLKPRSEDILNKIENILTRTNINIKDVDIDLLKQQGLYADEETLSIKINGKEKRYPYDISVEITIFDDFYYGQTVDTYLLDTLGLSISDTSTTSTTSTTLPKNYGNYTAFCEKNSQTVGILGSEDYLKQDTSKTDDYIKKLISSKDKGSSNSVSFFDSYLTQSSSPVVKCYNDDEWLPIIRNLLDNSNSDATMLLKMSAELRNIIPYGSSMLLDSLSGVAGYLSSNALNDLKKNIYVFTDNEYNASSANIEDCINDINSIDGPKDVPVVIGNISTVYPITLSARANTTDASMLNKISLLTGGQSLTILSEEFSGQVINVFTGYTIGSIGYGTFSFVHTFADGENLVKIINLQSLFDFYQNTNAKVEISVSFDGYVYYSIDEIFKPNNLILFEDLFVYSIKFNISLYTGFSSSDSIEYNIFNGGGPIFYGVTVTYSFNKKTYIYMNDQLTDGCPQQVVLSIKSTDYDYNKIRFGSALSASLNWIDYNSGSQPAVLANNKLVISKRDINLTDDRLREKLIKDDIFTHIAERGPWNPHDSVGVYSLSSSGEFVEVPASKYVTYPRLGMVVFSTNVYGNFYIEIVGSKSLCLAVEIDNDGSIPEGYFKVNELGYMYTEDYDRSRVSVGIAGGFPLISNIDFVNNSPEVYSVISISYDYSDPNNVEEDLSKRKIEWYINDIHIVYLDNLAEWNNVLNRFDPLYEYIFNFDTVGVSVNDVLTLAKTNRSSILKLGDKLHCKIQVSNGVYASPFIKSESLIVSESSPIVNSILIHGSNSFNGSITGSPTTSDNLLVKYNLIADSNADNSIIEWYVNGSLYKSERAYIEGSNTITIDEFNRGVVPIVMNNEIYVIVKPESERASGQLRRSSSVIIGNSIPAIANAIIYPTNPSVSQDITLSYTFVDRDVTVLQDSSQFDNTTIKWYEQISGSWVELSQYEGQKIINNLYKGEKIKAILTPNDGLDSGLAVETNVAVVV